MRDRWRCVWVHGCDDERPTACGPEVVATECEVWRFRRLCNTILLESVQQARNRMKMRRFLTIRRELYTRGDVNRRCVQFGEREFE